MALAVKPRKPLKGQLTRIARNELDAAAERLLKADRTDDDVHEARKSVKKVEAVVALIQQIGGNVSESDLEALHTARRTLSRLRDADAAIQTFQRLTSRFPDRIPARDSSTIRRRLERRKADLVPVMRSNTGSLARTGKILRSLRRPAKQWAPSVTVAELPDVLRRSYRTSLEAMQRAADTGRADDFHAWRKAVKNLWYQLRVVERLVSGLTKQLAEFRELETALGDEHNLAVFRMRLARDRTLRREQPAVEDMMVLAAALEDELRRVALVLGKRLFEASPKKFAHDIERRLRPRGTPRRTVASGTRGRAVEL
jgi:CHAD domain-containing protein